MISCEQLKFQFFAQNHFQKNFHANFSVFSGICLQSLIRTVSIFSKMQKVKIKKKMVNLEENSFLV